MPIYELVDGKRVECSPEREAEILAQWAIGEADAVQRAAESQRCAEYDAAIAGDASLSQFRTMTRAQFDAWWDANVTNAASAIAVLKRLAWVVIRRCL